jgi:hypothetical protein
MTKDRRSLKAMDRPGRAEGLLCAAQEVGALNPEPLDGFLLRFVAPSSTWVEGFYEGEREARDRAHEMARRQPEITDAYIWEYEHDLVIRCRHIPLERD